MILYGGKIFESSFQDELLNRIEKDINRVLSTKTLSPKTVVDAVSQLGEEISRGIYDEELNKIQLDEPQRLKLLCAKMLSRENLLFKLKTELGNTDEYITNPPDNLAKIKVKTMPLGVIFHIAAGNMDALPAFSLAEGLLTGNINILKLPNADNGLSLKIISRLIEIEPQLADFIYVFDTPSTDIHAMKKMAQTADGISVWGGDAAIGAVRALAPVGAKLIEWGQKLGFCYISGYTDKASELSALAKHIVKTRQLLCSSCQTIFIDTDDENELKTFCEEFLPILENEVEQRQSAVIGERAYGSLIRHTELLDEIIYGKIGGKTNEFRGNGCRLIIRSDSDLELSPMMCTVLVKRLPKDKITENLRRKKGYLQTAGLICPPEKRGELCSILSACGVTRITTAGNMSEYFSGEAHDGEYALRRYVRTVNTEI